MNNIIKLIAILTVGSKYVYRMRWPRIFYGTGWFQNEVGLSWFSSKQLNLNFWDELSIWCLLDGALNQSNRYGEDVCQSESEFIASIWKVILDSQNLDNVST